MPWITLAVLATVAIAIVIAIGGFLYLRRRRRRQHRLIAFVALLKEPMRLNPAITARVAGKLWNVDLGDGSSPGADGFVVGIEVSNTIMHGDRMFLVNAFPSTYVKEVDATAEKIPDRRLGELFRQHQAWFSCDALGVDGATSEEEVRDWYRRLGPLFAEFLDDNAMLVFLPDTGLAFPINRDTENALRSPDPLEGLRRTMTVPIIEVQPDDASMNEATRIAHERWPEFHAAFENRAGDNFSVKSPITAGGNTEFIWITVRAIEGDLIYGELGNEPGNLGGLRLGSKVSVPIADLNDWCFMTPKNELVGGFTIQAIQEAARRRGK